MRLETLKPGEQILKGIKIWQETTNGSLSEVRLIDEEGNFVVLRNNNYNMAVFKKARPKLEKKIFVTGRLLGEAEVEREFEQQSEALEYIRGLQQASGLYDEEKLGLAIEEREVEVAD